MPSPHAPPRQSGALKWVGILLIAAGVGGFLYSRGGGAPALVAETTAQFQAGIDACDAGDYDTGLPAIRQAAERAHRLRQAAEDPRIRDRLNDIEADAYFHLASFALRRIQDRTRPDREAAKRAGETYNIPAGLLAGPEADIRRSLAVSASRPEAHFLLGFILREQGRLASAAAAFQEAVERATEPFPKAHNALGDVYYMLKNYDRAREHFNIAVQLNPEYAGAHLNLGLYYANRPPDARDAADVAAARKHLSRFLELAEKEENESAADIQSARDALAALPAPGG